MAQATEISIDRLLRNAALAFRGYNVTNLGRSPELLAHRAYGSVVRQFLDEASQVCSELTRRKVDLASRVERGEETDLRTYGEAIALIVAVEQAQLQLLAEFHGADYRAARLSFGFSLGEISALVAGGVFAMKDALRIPLSMADDAAALAADVTLGILFSRGEQLSLEKVKQILMEINQRGRGVIGVSTYLSPNSLLVMGTGDTLAILSDRLRDILPKGLHLRRNENQWPPLHTPIVWQKFIPNRVAVQLHTLPGGFTAPTPPVLSLVSGRISYDNYNARDHLVRWVDHTQRLWDAVYELLTTGIDTVIHIGGEPNIIPATLSRLATDVESQTRGSRRMRALSAVINRPWLKSLIPRQVALLRAPQIKQLVLEDWLLQHEPR